ncbi:alpha/beta hydrolase fold [Streptomyces malaysiensis subsp. malaysiensis]|nr:alpha/beta hydrolase fold [Streptomyces malaysiensis]
MGSLVGQQDREPVGPADEHPIRTGVADALGEAVADGCVRPDGTVAESLLIVCHVGTSFTRWRDLRHRNQGLTWGDLSHLVSFGKGGIGRARRRRGRRRSTAGRSGRHARIDPATTPEQGRKATRSPRSREADCLLHPCRRVSFSRLSTSRVGGRS